MRDLQKEFMDAIRAADSAVTRLQLQGDISHDAFHRWMGNTDEMIKEVARIGIDNDNTK